MINSEMLKSAIADAKAVRATALANAKASLEEAFAPRFEAMFAEKLKEESEEGQEEMVSEVEAPNQVSGKGGEAKGPATKAVSKGNPKKVSDAASNFKTVAIGGSQGAAGSKAPAATQSIVKETAEEDEVEKLDEVEAQEESGLTTEDLDQIIKELEAEVSGGQEGQEPALDGQLPQVPAPAPAPVGEIPGAEGEIPAPAPTPEGEPDGDEAGMNAGVPAPAPVAAPAPEDEINLEELLSALNEESEEEEVSEGKLPPWLKKKGEKGEDKEKEEKEEIDEISNNGVPKAEKGQDAAYKNVSTKSKNHGGDIGTGEIGGKPKLEEGRYKVALKEAYDTITYLRGQINEVNLLNAKLLYTNKLFKEFAGVLDDSHRMKIVEHFDLTKNVREVKLAYAGLSESLNFSARTSAPKTVQKPVQKKVVTQIAEGMASRTVASTKPNRELISEGNEMALRFKKLAGIKETPKS